MYNNFNAVYSLAQTLYGISLNPQEFEDIAMNGWERIGNKHCKLHRYIGDTVNKELQLPCNTTALESVHIPKLDYKETQPYTVNMNYYNLYVENYIESWKRDKNLLYEGGRYVKYRIEDNSLVFSEDYKNVMIIYHGVITDDDGLPLLSDKEVNAIAAYVAYSAKFKESLIRNDANSYQIAAVLKADWLKYCNNARTPDKITQNEIDEILDVKSRWDRKQYGISYKPVL